MTETETIVPAPRRADSSASPRILYVTEFWPHKTTIGAELRSLHVLRALEKIGKVEVVVLDDGTENNPTHGTRKVDAVRLEQRTNRGLAAKLQWMCNPRSSYPHGCGVNSEAAQRILRSAHEFDLVWFFKLRSANMFPYTRWPNSVVDVDDVPSTYERTTRQRETSLRKRLPALARLVSLKRREKLLGERFKVVTVCSEGDRQYLKDLGVTVPMHVIPNGSEKPRTEPVRRPATPPRIGFIGLFEYIANREGIHWFAKECWPRIKQAVPDARLRLVGQGSDGPLKPPGADIDGLGWLADTSEEISTWSAMVVPIRIGAGTRVKIAYGFGLKCPIVSTSLGAFGYDVRDGQELFLADGAEGFADACVKTIHEPSRAREMAERANKKFLEKWTWEAIEPRIWAAAEECLRLSASSAV